MLISFQANIEGIINQSQFDEKNKQNLKHIFYAITQRRVKTSIGMDSIVARGVEAEPARHGYMQSNCTSLVEIQDFFKEIRPLFEILNTPAGNDIKRSSYFTAAVVDWVQKGLNEITIQQEEIASIFPLIENIRYNLSGFGYADKLKFSFTGGFKTQKATSDKGSSLFDDSMFETLPPTDKNKVLPSFGNFDLGSIFEFLSPNKKIIPSISEDEAPPDEQSQNNTSQKLAEEIEKIKDPNFLEFIFGHTNLLDSACENFSEDFKTKLIENETLWEKLDTKKQGKIIEGSINVLMEKLHSLSDEQVFDLLVLIKQNKVNSEFNKLDFLENNKEVLLQRVNQIKDNKKKLDCKDTLRRIIESAIKTEKGILSQNDYMELFSISLPEVSRMSLEQRFRDLIGLNCDTNTDNFEFFFNFDSSNNFLTTYKFTSQSKIKTATTLDTQIFIDKSGKEISDADKQILIGLCFPNKQSYYLQAYLSQKEKSGQFTADLLLDLYNKLNSETLIDVKSDYKPPLSEAPGFSLEDKNRRLQITVRDMAYFRYFHKNLSSFIEKAKNGKHQEIITWFKKYYPESSSYRDVILNQIYNHDEIFEGIKAKNIQKEIMSLFHDEHKSSGLKLKYYNQHAGLSETLHEDLNFLFDIYPEPSPERDIQIEKILDSHPFNLQEFDSIQKEFSSNSLKYLQKADSGQTWLEEYYAHLEPNEKSDLFLWMTGKQKNKPSSIINQESYLEVDLSELKDLFKFKSYRDSQIQALFAGQKGLFAKSNQVVLDRLLEKVLSDYFAHDKDAETNKLKDIFKFSIKEAFHLENNVKKLKFMQNLVDLLSSSESKTFEDFACNALSISPVFVKLGQALGSQITIKEKFPTLYSKLQSLKDNNQPLSYLTLRQAIATQPELAKQDIIILKPLATASVGGTWLAIINGQKKVIKVVKPGIADTIEQEKKEFGILKSKIIPEMKRIYGLEHVPDLEKRIFHALEIEANLREEAINNKQLEEIINQGNTSKNQYNHFVPAIDEEHSNAILLIEDFVEGQSLTDIQKSGNSAQIEEAIKQQFWQQVQNGFFHADPHSGNFIIKNNEIYWIDTGLCVKLPANLISFLQEKEVQNLIKEFSIDEFSKLAQALSEIGVDKITQLTSKQTNPLNLIGVVLNLFKQSQNINKYYKLYQLLQKHKLDKAIIDFISKVGVERIKTIYEKVNKATAENKPLVLLNELDAIKDMEKPVFIDLLLLALGRGSYLSAKVKN